MPQSLTFGSITVYFYGIFVGLGVLSSYYYCSKKCRYFGLNQKNIDYLFLPSLPFSLLGARLYHVFSSWQYYKTNPLEMLNIQNGGLGIFGLLIGSFVGLAISAKLQKIKLFPCINLIFPSFLLAQSIGRIGNYFNQEGFGPNHFPTFLLESLLCSIAFLLFLFVIKKTKKNNFGFDYYLITYGLIRFFTEFFRRDTWMINGIKLAWVFSGIMLVSGLFLLFKKKIHPYP